MKFPIALSPTRLAGIMAAGLSILTALPVWASTEIAPFTSDGCSLFPDGTHEAETLWLDCCRAHDLAYWRGGTYRERLEADRELEACVADAGEPEIAGLMLAGVRVGGSPFLPTSFRWGYGWPYLRGYEALSEEELSAIRAALGGTDPRDAGKHTDKEKKNRE
ncbi:MULTISPECIES: FAD-binding oxidoreductase [Microbulbifer]|uniref:FAD-binding oxidoreductase n=1 Tax=Microbulbifer TaxID=48073 RepID=UPI001E656CEF|nr:FAD-binding oxidoreductase [Microbulbifer sp. YPW16]UHQ53706.1 FAD-binding oxidoreductase [Microbulbifer sp. YPW16]